MQLAWHLTSAVAVAITCDGWTSVATKGYLDMTAHWLTADFVMKVAVLRVARLTDHSGEVREFVLCLSCYFRAQGIAAVLNAAFRQFAISEKAFHATSDNGPNIVKAIGLLPSCLHSRCFAHTLQLLVNKALAAYDELIARCKALVTLFHHSANAADRLRTVAKALTITISELKQAEPTRWQSVFFMLDSIVQLWPAVQAIQSDSRSGTKPGVPLVPVDKQLTEDDFTTIKALATELSAYAQITTLVSDVV